MSIALTKKNDDTQKPSVTRTHLKKKRKKRIWLIIIIVAIIAAIVFVIGKRSAAADMALVSYEDISTVSNGNISNAISATGTVESNDSHMVYSTLSYTVQEVFVEVGDKVTADTLLCQLDGTSLQEQLETREASSGLSSAASAQSVKTAQDNYNAAKKAVDNGTNSTLVSAENAVRTAKENWEKANTAYENYAATLNDGLNATLISQDGSVKTAANNLESAKAAYDNALDALEDAEDALDDFDPDTSEYDSKIDQADAAYKATKLLLEETQSAYDMAQLAYQDALSSDDTALIEATAADLEAAAAELESTSAALDESKKALKQFKDARANYIKSAYTALEEQYDAKELAFENAERALDTAQTSYDTAVKSREAAYNSADTTLADYATNVENAYAAYEAAQASYAAAKAGVESSLQSSYNSLQSAKINSSTEVSDLELESLRKDIADTSIYAMAEGTVTAVYAEVGYSGAGLLFVIEDTEDLIIETSVKEYDVGTVEVGMPVTIKSEGTGNDVYEGEILSVAPTATKNAMGTTNTAGEIEFAVKVKVNSSDTRLKIGMNVRLNLIIEEGENVLTVPYDAVYTNDIGQSCVMILQEGTDGSQTLYEVVVETGIANDTDIVISGTGIEEGMQIISSPSSYKDMLGKTVTLTTYSSTLIEQRMSMLGG